MRKDDRDRPAASLLTKRPFPPEGKKRKNGEARRPHRLRGLGGRDAQSSFDANSFAISRVSRGEKKEARAFSRTNEEEDNVTNAPPSDCP